MLTTNFFPGGVKYLEVSSELVAIKCVLFSLILYTE